MPRKPERSLKEIVDSVAKAEGNTPENQAAEILAMTTDRPDAHDVSSRLANAANDTTLLSLREDLKNLASSDES